MTTASNRSDQLSDFLLHCSEGTVEVGFRPGADIRGSQISEQRSRTGSAFYLYPQLNSCVAGQLVLAGDASSGIHFNFCNFSGGRRTMISALLMIQAISQNIAIFFSALFAGGSVYVSLVEDPATKEGGPEMAGAYLVTAHPRPAIVQASFAAIAALAGLAVGFSSNSIWWVIGGVILTVSTFIHLLMVIPLIRRLTNVGPPVDPQRVSRLLSRLTRLHGVLCLASLAALFIFILRT